MVTSKNLNIPTPSDFAFKVSKPSSTLNKLVAASEMHSSSPPWMDRHLGRKSDQTKGHNQGLTPQDRSFYSQIFLFLQTTLAIPGLAYLGTTRMLKVPSSNPKQRVDVSTIVV